MGEVGATRRHGSGKPRPLGQVKSETLHFHTATWVPTRPSFFLPGPIYPVYPVLHPHCAAALPCHNHLYSLPASSIKSMRDLRESLRHAALLNIVASANNGSPIPEDPPPKDGRVQSPGATPSRLVVPPVPKKRAPSPLALQVTSSRGSPFPQHTESGGRSAGNGTYHIPHRDSGVSSCPQTLVANLLSPRIRTISIPRPGPQVPPDLPGPFIHKSVSLAKDRLTKVGLIIRPRGQPAEEEQEEEVSEESTGGGGGKPMAVPTPRSHDVSLLKVNGVGSAAVSGLVLTARGPALDKSHHPYTTEKSSHQHPQTAGAKPALESAGSSGSLPSAQSRSTAITVTSTTLPPSASVSSDSSRSTADVRSAAAGKTKKKGLEDRSSNSLHMRRHLTPGKKRELVMRLSEMAKCEAMDMAHPLARWEEADTSSMPPMIIKSQQRLEQKRPEDSAPEATTVLPSSQNGTDFDLHKGKRYGGGVHRTKSLLSLTASRAYNYDSLVRATLPTHKNDDVLPDLGSLQGALSGSMPDLVGKEGEQQSNSPKPSTLTTVSDSKDDINNSESLFTNGIVGKTIGRDGEDGGKSRMEARPLLPATHHLRPRHGRRHSGRRSSLRDREPVDPTVTTTTFTSTTVLSLTPVTPRSLPRSNSFTSETTSAVVTSEHSSATSPVLPILTITGLRKDMTISATAASTTGSTSAQPFPRTTLNQRLHRSQQLDHQCEKLQRQLNISLTVPRRPPHWQHGSVPQDPLISRSDVSIHLQCMALGEGRGPSSSLPLLPQPFQRSAGVSKALSDVEEHSVQDGASGWRMLTDRTRFPDKDGQQEEDVNGRDEFPAMPQLEERYFASQSPADPDAASKSISVLTDVSTYGGPGGEASASPEQGPGTATPDPVLQTAKEPRYQGFSSKVSKHEGRNQFHYVNPPSGLHEPHMPEEVHEMRYRVLKALDQDVYYDFQHRKYRNSPANATAATPASRCNNEEDKARVHFYKVKINVDT